VGGKPGVGNYCLVHCDSPAERRVDAYADEQSPPGDLVLFKSCGGGGWGNPLDRDPQAVLADVRNDYVSIEGAERDYGVVIRNGSGPLTLDLAATERMRSERRAHQPA
jgi:N-methylhydantoinase B